MASTGLRQLTLLMLLAFLGHHVGAQGQTVVILPPTSNFFILPTNYPQGGNSNGNSQSAALTYPPTPVYSRLSTAIQFFQSSYPVPATTIPSGLPGPQDSTPLRLFTPTRVTALRASSFPAGPDGTNLPSTNLQPLLQSTSQPMSLINLQGSTFPSDVTAPSSSPQQVQISFNNRYSDVGVTDLDMYANRINAQNQLSQICKVSSDRITDVSLQANSSGCLVLRFTIQQGYPVYISEAVPQLQARMQSPGFMTLSSQQLLWPVALFWTSDGPCPTDRCTNGGACDVALSGYYLCRCGSGYSGSYCQDKVHVANVALFALLVLLIIPIAIAVAVGFYFGIRRQQKRQLKRAFDLRDVRTIGPKSMLSLPQEQGMRNQMYDTRSFAMAFTDKSFSASSNPGSEEELVSHLAA